ncbi:MAG: galactokinase [Actinomycetota bacterium]
MTPTGRAVERAVTAFRDRFGDDPPVLVRAPGRVNLIGEHTDYNDGFAMPMALPFDIAIAAKPVLGTEIIAHSEGFPSAVIDLASNASVEDGWAAYVHGVTHILEASHQPTHAWHGCIASDIPAGASLSSSAALTMAAGLTTLAAGAHTIDPVELALIGQRVENEVLGMPCGNLDQLASVSGRPDAAMLIDCRSLEIASVPLPANTSIVVMDTGTRRKLVDSEFAARRATCERAAAELGVDALRDATIDRLAELDDTLLVRRARHVISENDRTLAAAEAARNGNAVELGRLMSESHASLHHDFEVTGPATDAISRLAQTLPGCFGARMTGGGFAGGAVALVATDAVEDFVDAMTRQFEPPTAQPAVEPVRYWPVHANAGAEVLAAASHD